MARFIVMSLNGEDMGDLVPKNLSDYPPEGKGSQFYWRAKMLAKIITSVGPHIIGLVEAPVTKDRTEKFVHDNLDDGYDVYQAERRGILGLAFLIGKNLDIQVKARTKEESNDDFRLAPFDADGDGIKELYSWYNRVPYEVEMSGGGLEDKTKLVLIHAKSKGAFIPGDLFAYDRLSRANRMKLRAQAAAVRRRLDELVGSDGSGRVVVFGDMNDGPEFDHYAAMLGGAFLEPVMGSIWDPANVFFNTHANFNKKDRWTIDFSDRVVNPLKESRYGMPTELRSWIDHILVSPALKDGVEEETAGIVHRQPLVPSLPRKYRGKRGTDHHPPYVDLNL